MTRWCDSSLQAHLSSVQMLHAGSGPNGAIIHYRAEQSSCRKVGAGTLLHILDAVMFDKTQRACA